MIEASERPNRLYKIEYNDGTVFVRATSIIKAIAKWTDNGKAYYTEDAISSITVIFCNVDDFKVVYW